MRGSLKSAAEKFGALFKNKAKEAINDGSSFVSKNAESVYQKGKAAAVETARTAARTAYKQGKDVTLSQIAEATTRASSVMRDKSSSLASSARTASKEASHIVRDASSTIASTAKEAAKEAAEEAKIEAKKGIKWFMWWSLAAIGVYGVATTVSKELVRHALLGPSKGEERLIESSRSGDGDASKNSGRWSWLTSAETKQKNVEEDGSSALSSWFSWGGRSS